MERINAIIDHPIFRSALEGIVTAETDRLFCRHGMAHLLDTARIAYILNLESGGTHNKESIYAAALLHDIGRFRQYKDGTPHDEESVRLASVILPECGFTLDETAPILAAISAHRERHGGKSGLTEILRRADKLSRRCFSCAAAEQCNWPAARKNQKLEY